MAIISNKDRKFLIWKYSSGINKGWTILKWWIEEWETKQDALFREIYEEIWLKEDLFEIVCEFKDSYKKYFTVAEIEEKVKIHWEKYGYSSSEHFVYFLNFIGDDEQINITLTNEFSEYKWIKSFEFESYLNKDLCKYLETILHPELSISFFWRFHQFVLRRSWLFRGILGQ